MSQTLVENGAAFAACGTCMETRDLATDEMLEAMRQSAIDEVMQWTCRADKVLVF